MNYSTTEYYGMALGLPFIGTKSLAGFMNLIANLFDFRSYRVGGEVSLENNVGVHVQRHCCDAKDFGLCLSTNLSDFLVRVQSRFPRDSTEDLPTSLKN